MDTNSMTETAETRSWTFEELQISKHAAVRCQQRGLRLQDLRAIRRHADIYIPRGNGVELIRISKRKLGKMGKTTPEGVAVDRLKKACLLLAADNMIVTVFHPRKGKYKKAKPSRRTA